MKINVILITGNELRHKFFASYMSTFKNINLKFVIHEKNFKLKNNPLYRNDVIVNQHINERNKSERRFFKKFVQNNKKYKFNTLKNGEINTDEVINLIKTKKVNFIVSYGCSIVKKKFINTFKNKFLNIHLGLSPYYKGSGTNFFPFVNNELQFCGSTIMKISSKLDSGKILHQIRPEIRKEDDIHSVGNKIIKQTVHDLCKILLKEKPLKYYSIKTNYKTKTYKRKDFNKKKLLKALNNLKNNMVTKYLLNKNNLYKKYPIIKQL